MAHKLSLKRCQSQVFRDKTRFKILVTGRRFGKTYFSLVTLIEWACKRPGGLFYYLAPTYDQAKDIAWDTLKSLVPKVWLKKKPNESELYVLLKNGSKIALKGVDKPDTLVGRGLSGVTLDESALYKDKQVWEKIILPSLADHQGEALFTTTIRKGFRAQWFMDLYDNALLMSDGEKADLRAQMPPEWHRKWKNWKAWTFTTLDGENVEEEEIQLAMDNMDPDTFRQEFLAIIGDQAGRVASCFTDENVLAVEDDPKLPLLVGIDFNVDPFRACFATKKPANSKDPLSVEELHVFDKIGLIDATTWDMAEYITQRFGSDRQVIAYPDPTGDARKTSSVGLTDHGILRKAGYSVVAPAKPWRIRDKVTAVNTSFRTASGRRYAYINPRCLETIKSMRNLMFDDKTGLPDKTQGLDHAYDCYGYMVLSAFNLVLPTGIGTTTMKIYGSSTNTRAVEERKRMKFGGIGVAAR